MAVEVVGCTAAAITALRRRTVSVVAASDHSAHTAALENIDSDGRTYTHVASEAGEPVIHRSETTSAREDAQPGAATSAFGSAASFPLSAASSNFGVLTFYDTTPGWFTPDVMAGCTRYAEYATLALRTTHAEDRNNELTEAVETNRDIGVAVGIVMSRYRVNRDDAFGMLVTASSHQNRKLRDIALDTVDTGDIPARPHRAGRRPR